VKAPSGEKKLNDEASLGFFLFRVIEPALEVKRGTKQV